MRLTKRKRTLLAGCACAGFLLISLARAQKPELLTNQGIVEMVKAGLGADLIAAKIESSQVNFDLSTQALIALKQAGVSDEILRSMMARQSAAMAPPPPAAAQGGDGASIPAARSKAAPLQFPDAEYLLKVAGQEKAQPIKGMLVFDPGTHMIRFLSGGVAQLEVPYQNVNSLLYERAAKPRYGVGLLVAWPLLFTKSKKHFLTIQYRLPEGNNQFTILRLDKKNFQTALATAEAETGKKVERTEER